MACVVTITSKNPTKKTLTVEEIAGSDLAYGVMDDNYRLDAGKTGTYTVLYAPAAIGRGFEVCPREDEVEMILTFPNSRSDIELFYLTVQRICGLYGTKQFQCDGNAMHLSDVEHLIQQGVDLSLDALRQAAEQVGSGKVRSLTIFGAVNPLCIGEKEIARFGSGDDRLDRFGEWLNEKQRLDSFYASPRYYSDQNGNVWGCCFIGSGIVSTVALSLWKPLGADENIEISAWYAYVSHYNSDEPGVKVPYDRFIAYVSALENTTYYDAEHIVICLTDEEVDELTEPFKTQG